MSPRRNSKDTNLTFVIVLVFGSRETKANKPTTCPKTGATQFRQQNERMGARHLFFRFKGVGFGVVGYSVYRRRVGTT